MAHQTETIIDHWAREAIQHAVFEQLADGRWFAHVPGSAGAVATGDSKDEAKHELFSVLGEWALLGIQLGDDIPVYGNIDLNTEEVRVVSRFER